LSARIHAATSPVLQVSGPMGHGLSVDLKSVNVAFAAGTGVLPFMDMVGYIARHTLGLDGVDSSKPADGFQFWFNVRCSAHEAIADELMSALATANPSMFRYDIVKKDRE